MSRSDEQFETWFMDMQDLAERCGVSLNGTDQDRMEAAWEASRQQLEVKLPAPDHSYDNHGQLLSRDSVIAALEAAGLRVAP